MSVPIHAQVPPRGVDARRRPVAPRSRGAPSASSAFVDPQRAAATHRPATPGGGWSELPLAAAGCGRDSRARLTSSLTAAGGDAVAAAAGVQSLDLGWPRGFDDEFEVQDGEEGLLGVGSFGVVRLAKRRATGKTFAVKTISKRPPARGPRRKDDDNLDGYSQILRAEVSLWSTVQNSHDAHVVKLHGVYEDDSNVYIVEDLCQGGDLHRLLQKRGSLTEKEAAQAIAGVLHLLVACHEEDICFGDVKPANFLLETPYPCRRHQVDPSAPKGDLVVKGVDFGCSQKVPDDNRLRRRTGTPLYMAPEIMFGWYGVEVDVWAAGMMLYQLLCGKFPFFGEKVDELKNGPLSIIVQALMDTDLEFNGEKWDDVSEEAKDLISKMLDVDYNSRISARDALQHPWITRYNDHTEMPSYKKTIGISASNILDFPGSPGSPLSTSKGTDDQQGGNGSS